MQNSSKKSLKDIKELWIAFKNKSVVQKIGLIIFIAGFLAMLYNFAFFIGKNSVDIPFWDQWGLADIITEKNSISEILLHQHNEHRIGTALVFIETLAKLTNWSQIAEIKFVSSMIVISCFIILFLKVAISKRINLLDLLIPFLFLNIFQFQNIAWGFQIAFVFPILFFSLGLLSLRIKDRRKRNTALVIISLLSSYSSLHGIFVPIIFSIFLIFDYLKLKRSKLKLLVITLAANILIVLSYFINYTKSYQAKLLDGVSLEVASFFSRIISSGFLYLSTTPIINWGILATTVLFSCIALFKVFQKKTPKSSLIGLLLISYSIIFAFFITIGRFALGPQQAVESRYVTFMMLIPIGLFFIFSNMKGGNILKAVLFLFIFINSIYQVQPILDQAKGMTGGKQKALKCYDVADSSNYEDCFEIFTLYPNKEELNKRLPKVLRMKGLNKSLRYMEKGNYFETLPEGKEEIVSADKIITILQNVTRNGDTYTSLNNDPNITINNLKGIKGISWKSNAKGNTRLYYSYNKEREYSEAHSELIKGKNGTFMLNIVLLNKTFDKKLKGLRIDPTDQMEEFEITEFKVYK